MKNVTGAMIPCHNPRQNPATTRFSGEGRFNDSLGPAAQADNTINTAMKMMNVKTLFFIVDQINL